MTEKPVVLHLERKFTSPTETFIHNQLNTLSSFTPVVGTAFDTGNIPYSGEVLSPQRPSIFEKKALILRPAVKKELLFGIEQINPVLVHTHYTVDAYFFLPLTRKLKIPKVCSAYGYDVSSFPTKFLGYAKTMMQKVFAEYDYFFAMSDDMKRDFISLGCPAEKVIVHYYGTDTTRFRFPDRVYTEKDIVNILTVGTVEEKKAQHLIVKALKILVDKGINNFHYHIVGRGPYTDIVKNEIALLGIGNYVTMHGFVPYKDTRLNELYEAADIFIHPSITLDDNDKEGIPGTIIEAMANGLPVVTTYHAGIPYIIEHNVDGILLKERDITGMANSLEQLIMDRSKREQLGKAGASKAINKLDLAEKTKELELLYTKILSGKLN